jgi:hypothetical protein
MPEAKKIMVAAAKSVAIPVVALGEEDLNEVAEVVEHQPHTIDEKIAALEARQDSMVQMMDNMFALLKDIRAAVQSERDIRVSQALDETVKAKSMAIPEGTVLNGKTKGLSYFLQVKSGAFYVGNTRYTTLSAAAEAVSGVRRSGLTFWKLDDGRTVKEVFKR